LALGAIADQAERGSGRAGPGEDAEQNCIMEAEDVFADI
jgi:hypothetical protein